MDEKSQDHSKLMDEVFRKPNFKNVIDLWSSFFNKSREKAYYSDWRYLNQRRKDIENGLFKKYIGVNFKILDVGCSNGFYLKRIYENWGDKIKYYGVDISQEVIKIAKKTFPNAKYSIAPGEKLPFENQTFDYIQNISTIEHVIAPKMFLEESYRVLKKRGYLYIVFHKNSLDPFLLLSIRKVFETIVNKIRKNNPKRLDKYVFNINYVRDQINKVCNELNLKLIERSSLVSYINIDFYRKLKIPMLFLMKIAELTNKTSINLFKNLEYRIYMK